MSAGWVSDRRPPPSGRVADKRARLAHSQRLSRQLLLEEQLVRRCVRVALLALLLTLVANFSEARASRESDDWYVGQLRTHFGPLQSSDDDLRILLQGPGGNTYRASLDSARMGEAIYGSSDEQRLATLYLAKEVLIQTFDFLLAAGSALLVRAGPYIGARAIVPAVEEIIRGAWSTIQDARGEHPLIGLFATVYVNRQHRELLQNYVAARISGQDHEGAWSDLDEAIGTTNIVATIADQLGITPAEYPEALRRHYELVRFAHDAEVIAAIRDAIDATTALLQEYRRDGGLVKELRQGTDGLQVVNSGPADIAVSYLRDDDLITQRFIAYGETASIAIPGGWASLTDVRVSVAGVGTFTVPFGAFNTNLWHDPIDVRAVHEQTYDLGIDRVLARYGDQPHTPSIAWTFGDGQTQEATVGNVRHAFSCPGTYNVSAAITAGPFAATSTVPVDVADAWGLQVIAGRTGVILPSTPVEFSTGGDVPATNVSYMWSFGDGAVANTRDATHAFTQERTHVVTLTVTDATTGCKRIATKNISVGSSYTALPSRITRDMDLERYHVYVTANDGTTIDPGATVTAGEGTIIKIRTDRRFYVNGRLRLAGTPSGRVTVTSFDDDSVGGDTNGNGPSVPTKWVGLSLAAEATLNATYATIAGASTTIELVGTATLSDTRIARGAGLQTYHGSSFSATRMTFDAISSGPALALGNRATITDTTILGNTGVRLDGGSSLIDGLSAPDSTVPVSMNAGSSSSTLRNVSAAAGARYEITGGDFAAPTTWAGTDLPYRLVTAPGGQIRTVHQRLQMLPGVRVLIDPGASLYVQSGATLDLAGTSSAPITIDRWGTTNYNRISIYAGATLNATHATIAGAASVLEMAGTGSLTDTRIARGAGVQTYSSSLLTATRMTFDAISSGPALAVGSAGNTITDTTILGNTGVRLDGGSSLIDGLSAPDSTVPVSMNAGSSSSTLRNVSAAAGARYEITGGDFAAPTTWAGTDLPYRLVTAPGGQIRTVHQRLQMLPGVRVLIDPGASLYVQSGATLDLAGTSSAPITIDRWGTTNYNRISIYAGATLNATHATIAGAASVLEMAGTGSLTDTRIARGAGVQTYSSSLLTATRMTFDAISSGPALAVGSAGNTITDTTILGNTGVRLDGGSSLIDGLSAPDSTVPVSMNAGSSSSTLRNVSAAAGARYEITGGDFAAPTTWAGTDLPYRLVTAPGGQIRTVHQRLQMLPGVRVLIDPGASLYVQSGATLDLAGTSSAPITIDRWGTTNYNRISIYAGATLNATHATIAGAASVLEIAGTATLHRNQLLTGMAVSMSAMVDATHNWWGTSNGPTGLGPGAVTGPVAVSPWCANSACTEFYPRASQVIVFTSTRPSSPVVGGSYVVTASGGASGNPVRFSVGAASDGGACSVTASGAVSFTGAGTCVIAADQDGSADYAAAEQQTQTMVVGRASQVIVFTSTRPSSPVVGGSYVVTASGGASGNPVRFSVGAASDGGACSVTASGAVSFTGAGTCVIAADQDGSADYAAAEQQTQTMVVGRASQVIVFTSTRPSSPVVGGSYVVTASGGDSGNPVRFSVGAASDGGACSVTASGAVSFTGAGTCVIAADQDGSADYAAAEQQTQTMVVGRASQVIVFTSTRPSSPVVGGSYVVTASGGDSGNPVRFSVGAASDGGACSVTASGAVSFTGAGTCVIAADQDGSADYAAAEQQTQTMVVGRASQVIVFTSTRPSSPVVGGSYVVTASGGDSGNPVRFSVGAASDGGACSVTASGAVSFTGAGTCVIAADQDGSADYAAAEQQTQTMVVGRASQVIVFTSTRPSSPVVGGSYVVTASGGDSGNPVRFSVGAASDGGACSVTASGAVSFTGAGTCVIAADQDGSADYAAAERAIQTLEIGPAPGPTPPPDMTAPEITITTPSEGQRFASHQAVTSAFSCNDASGSGVQSCSGPANVDTVAVGGRQFTVTASDVAGNVASKIVNYIVDGPPGATPQPPPGAPRLPLPPPPPPLPPIDTKAPAAALTGSAQNLARTIVVSISCIDENCTATTVASVRVPRIGASKAKTYSLKAVRTQVPKGRKVTIKLMLSVSARTAIRRALRARKKVVVSVRLTVVDAADNKRMVRRQVQLKP